MKEYTIIADVQLTLITKSDDETPSKESLTHCIKDGGLQYIDWDDILVKNVKVFERDIEPNT